MTMKKLTLAAAVAATMGLGVAEQAAASVYARSYLDINDLHILVTEDWGNTNAPSTNVSITSFTFQIDDSAQLNNSNPLTSFGLGCGGTPGVPSGSTNTCGVDPALTINVANAPGSTVLRGEDDFSIIGPGTDQYANADTIIHAAQLTGDAATHTEQIAEAELQSGFQAASSTEIQSTTNFTMNFQVTGAAENAMFVEFDALLDILAKIDDPTGTAQSAQANVSVSFTLSQNDGDGFYLYQPNGSVGGCVGLGGTNASCTEIADGFDLNGDPGTGTDGTEEGRENITGAPADQYFAFVFEGLNSGSWTLSLNATTSTSLLRQQQVPAPGALALLGAGLIGMSAVRRRRKV